MLEAVKSDYIDSSKLFKNWISRESISEEDIDSFFTLVKENLDIYRYKNNAYQKVEIIRLVHSIDPCIAEDLNILIDRVIFLLQGLKIHYHNIQHTLEVTLGTTQAVVQHSKEGLIKDSKFILLPIVAALFHDVGYSNEEEIILFIQKPPSDACTLLFHMAKDPGFLEDFKLKAQNISDSKLLTGAEFHLHHVCLSQIILPKILGELPDTFINKEFLLSKESLEKINAIISLTDIKPDPKKYRDGRRNYLQEQGLLFLGESVATCDLLTQLSTSDRLSKGLALYHEFYFGCDDKHWLSGLSLMGTTTGFYESFAKKLINTEVLSALDRYFSSKQISNYYRTNINLIFFLHKLFEPVYQKLLLSEPLTDQDMTILHGLKKNGLQKEVVDLFLAAKSLQNKNLLPMDLEKGLYDLLKEKDSFLEVALGDEVRIILMKQAALMQDSEKMIQLFMLRKPELLIKRSFDVLEALQMMQDQRVVEVAMRTLLTLPEDTHGLANVKESLFRMQISLREEKAL